MRIAVVGGIFDKPEAYRFKHSISPETVLAEGLRERGWDVVTCGHATPVAPGTFDLVHVHHFGRGALRLALGPKPAPFVFTTHDPFAMNGLAVGWRRKLTDALVLRHADRVVALSNAERDFLVRRYSLAPRRVVVIPNGIDTRVFDRVAEEGREERLLFVGQLQEFKGLDYLLEALAMVRTERPRVRLRLVYQTGALLERYQAQAARLGLEGAVEFAGPRNAADLAREYSAATLVVAPSLGECLSTVVLEAMCCGAAVVATAVGGIREQLDAETGVIVPARDAGALAYAIARLLADGEWRRSLGEAARRKARAQFTIRAMIDRHVRLYEEVLGVHGRAA